MKMRNFWCLFFVVSLPADSFTKEKKAKEVIGILGKSVNFFLKTSQQFTSIFWLRQTSNNFNVIATVESGPPCRISYVRENLKERLNVSRNCSGIQITNLQEDDSGEYKAEVQQLEEAFRLEVYKTLSESDLKVRCEKNITLSDGNYTLKLNCSAGKWGDGVEYNWTSTRYQQVGKISQVLQIHFRDDEVNYTCTAQNRVSKASKTVSIKEACEANPTTGPGTVATTETGTETNGEPLSNEKLILLCIVPAIVVMAATGVGYLLWKKHKGAAHRMPPDPTGCTVRDESKTIYAQIDCIPPATQRTGMTKSQPQNRPKAKEGLHTVYSSVQPKPPPILLNCSSSSPASRMGAIIQEAAKRLSEQQSLTTAVNMDIMTLQTDDEKIQMGGRGTSEKSEKTIYSTITKPQETDDSSIKTVYDTVNAPRCPEGLEFRKLL